MVEKISVAREEGRVGVRKASHFDFSKVHAPGARKEGEKTPGESRDSRYQMKWKWPRKWTDGLN